MESFLQQIFVPMMCCMGVREVKAVKDLTPGDANAEYDYVIVKDDSTGKFRADLEERSGGSVVVDIAWMKECLILGEILPDY